MSLIEVLVALSLIGLAVSISGVAVRPLIERQESRDRLRLTESIVRQARFEAMLSGKPISLENFAADRPVPPDETALTIRTDVEVYPSGLCSPGDVQLQWNNASAIYTVERFDCAIRFGHAAS